MPTFTFQDIFKSSFLERLDSVSLLDTAIALALAQEFFFKVVAEIEIQLVGGRKLFLADNAGKAARVAYLCITGEQLV